MLCEDHISVVVKISTTPSVTDPSAEEAIVRDMASRIMKPPCETVVNVTVEVKAVAAFLAR